MKNAKSDEIRLRGNSFILLLLRGRNSKMDEQAAYGTQGNGLTYSALFSDLIHIANPNYPPQSPNTAATMRQYFSGYLHDSHRTVSKKYYPFDNHAFQAVFENRYTTVKAELQDEMYDFCIKYLADDSPSMDLLTAGILEAIMEDPTIEQDADFYTGYRVLRKSQMPEIRNQNEPERINLPCFLLSVWHYIVINKPNASEGIPTCDDWDKSGDNQPADPNMDIGRNDMDKVCADMKKPPEADTVIQTDASSGGETVIAEVIDDADGSEKRSDSTEDESNTKSSQNCNTQEPHVTQNAKTINNINNISFNGPVNIDL